MPRCFVGTSGFAYPAWRGRFYPPELPSAQWLAFYAQHFPALELNVTFYRWPRPSTLRRWREQVAEDFRFVVKVHRSITHTKRLLDCGPELARLTELVAALKPAALLLQLPPSLAFEAERCKQFLEALPFSLPPLAWEARHRSFGSPEAVAFFREHGQSLVVADSGGRFPTFWVVTALPLYLRFHGPGALYASGYTEAQLEETARWVLTHAPADGEVYAFFNNDVGGHALDNARSFAQLLATAGLAPGC